MDKKTKIKFNVLAIFVIVLFSFVLTPKTLQNDTYYTIAIGEHILENGIDMQDPFSWHEDLPYTYPHWLYDVATYLVFEAGEAIGIGGFMAIYLVTALLSIILGVVLYYALNKVCKNQLVSFFITLGVMYLLKSFICARAQLVTYILFALTILFIEQFIETKKKRYYSINNYTNYNSKYSHSCMAILLYTILTIYSRVHNSCNFRFKPIL